jgi:hypothetical protein
MTHHQSSPAAAAPVAAVHEMEPMHDLASRPQVLGATAGRSAPLGDDRHLVLAVEHLLQLHVEFAQTYRTWLARRIARRPPFIPLAAPGSMSV